MAAGAAIMALFALGSGLGLMLGPWLWAATSAAGSSSRAVRLAGAALLFPQTCEWGSLAAAILLLIVTAAVAINLWRGQRAIDCGCGGMSSQPISWALVARNAVLIALTVPAARQSAGRALFVGDYVTLVGGVLALVGLYVAVNQLMTNAPFQIAHRH